VYDEIINFWFEEIESTQWWGKDTAFDRLIADRFLSVHEQAVRGELFQWRGAAEGRLAEVIVLDQFSRNIFRGTRESFASDAAALALAQEAVSAGADAELSSMQRSFLYMPFMHSESLLIHDVAIELFRKGCSQSALEFEVRHRDIIERFGRYPHRNDILGRRSTDAEVEFLKQPDSDF